MTLHDVNVNIRKYEVFFREDGGVALIKCDISAKLGGKRINAEIVIEPEEREQNYKFASALREHLLDTIKKRHDHAKEVKEEP